MYKTCWGSEVAYKQLFVWVEGPDDFEFFARIVRPILSKKYDSVHEIQCNIVRDVIL